MRKSSFCLTFHAPCSMLHDNMPVPVPPHAKKLCQTENLAVYEWPETLYDGSIKTFDAAIRPDAVAVIPFLDEQTILMGKQDQPGRETFWDVPGGKVDAGESFEQAVRREFYEETGYHAAKLMEWVANPYSGIIRFEERIFVAHGLTKDAAFEPHDAGERVEIIPLSWDDTLKLCFQGQLRRPLVALALIGMHQNPEQQKRLQTFFSL